MLFLKGLVIQTQTVCFYGVCSVPSALVTFTWMGVDSYRCWRFFEMSWTVEWLHVKGANKMESPIVVHVVNALLIICKVSVSCTALWHDAVVWGSCATL